jgi:hypothetical protein
VVAFLVGNCLARGNESIELFLQKPKPDKCFAPNSGFLFWHVL